MRHYESDGKSVEEVLPKAEQLAKHTREEQALEEEETKDEEADRMEEKEPGIRVLPLVGFLELLDIVCAFALHDYFGILLYQFLLVFFVVIKCALVILRKTVPIAEYETALTNQSFSRPRDFFLTGKALGRFSFFFHSFILNHTNWNLLNIGFLFRKFFVYLVMHKLRDFLIREKSLSKIPGYKRKY